MKRDRKFWIDAPVEWQSVAIRMVKGEGVEEPIFLQEITLSDVADAIMAPICQKWLHDSLNFHPSFDMDRIRNQVIMEILYNALEDAEFAMCELISLLIDERDVETYVRYIADA